MQLAKEKGIEGASYESLCEDKVIVAEMLANLTKQARADKLAGFELARKLHLHPVSFTDLGCFTTTMKLQRHNAKTIFKK